MAWSVWVGGGPEGHLILQRGRDGCRVDIGVSGITL